MTEVDSPTNREKLVTLLAEQARRGQMLILDIPAESAIVNVAAIRADVANMSEAVIAEHLQRLDGKGAFVW